MENTDMQIIIQSNKDMQHQSASISCDTRGRHGGDIIKTFRQTGMREGIDIKYDKITTCM